MRKIIVLMLLAALTILCCACSAGRDSLMDQIKDNIPDNIDDTDVIDGGMADLSDPNAKKTITSDDLVSFSLNMEESLIMYVDDPNGKYAAVAYPEGIYDLSIEKENDTVHVVADFAGNPYEFDADENALAKVNRMLKDHDVASMNGHSKADSALGSFIDLNARYADDETITIHAEGGASTIPYGWDSSIYVETFDALLKEYTGESFAETLVEDNSDISAPTSFSSDEIGEIYIEVSTDPMPLNRDGFPYGDYRIQYRDGGVPYTGIDTNAAVWRDNGAIASFDIDDEDMKLIKDWIASHDLAALNGWDQSSLVDSIHQVEMAVYYTDDETFSITASGKAAMPKQWDTTECLKLFQQIAEKHGEDLMKED